MPKVSVIIPIYGVEKYIERCARSLFEQTLDDMEFVFVNDCTKDKSIEVLKKVIEKYPHRKEQIVILHHLNNKGLSYARETGINVAKGEFIGHCDSDDWVEKDMYENMYKHAVKYSHDYVKCAHRKTNGNQTIKIMRAFADANLSVEKACHYLLHFNGWNSIWDTIIHRDVYKKAKLQYTDKAMLEDLYLTSQLLPCANSVSYLDKVFYNYYINTESICRTPGKESLINRTRQAKDNLDVIIGRLLSMRIISNKDIVVAKWGVKNMLIPIMDSKENKCVWNEIYPELRWCVLFSKVISFRNKARFYVADFNLYKYFKN